MIRVSLSWKQQAWKHHACRVLRLPGTPQSAATSLAELLAPGCLAAAKDVRGARAGARLAAALMFGGRAPYPSDVASALEDLVAEQARAHEVSGCAEARVFWGLDNPDLNPHP